MAQKSKRKIPTKNKRRSAQRQERRFVSQTASNPALFKVLGAVAALILGAGGYAFFYGKSFAVDEAAKQIPHYLVAAGAVLMGITIWMGTSSEAPVRIGDPGIAVEKAELRRMPWWAVDKIAFEAGALAIVVTGKDEMGVDWTFKLSLKSHPEAAGWLIKEAQNRIPRRIEIEPDTLEKLPGGGEGAGQKLDLEPLQVVGKRCAATGKTISYEPDATLCVRCERVYLKKSLPKKCKCGAPLGQTRAKDEAEQDESEGESESESDDGGRERASEKSEAAEETAES